MTILRHVAFWILAGNFIHSVSFATTQNPSLELGFKVKCEVDDVLKIYCELESDNWQVKERIVGLTPSSETKLYRFKFDSRIRNLRFLWTKPNTLVFDSLYIAFEGRQLIWAPGDIITDFHFSPYVSVSGVTGKELLLRSWEPDPQNNLWPILILENWGNARLDHQLYDKIDKISTISIEAKAESTIIAEVYTAEKFSDQFQGFKHSGRIYIPASNEVQKFTSGVLGVGDFEQFLLILKGGHDSSEVMIRNVFFDGTLFQRKWSFDQFRDYFKILHYSQESHRDDGMVFEFSEQIQMYYNTKLLSRGQEVMNTLARALLIAVFVLLFYLLNWKLLKGDDPTWHSG